MKLSHFRASVATAVVAAALAIAGPALAQAPAADAAADADQADDIIVTGVAKGQNRLDSSISVSSLNAEAIQIATPRSAAELFRSIPGIRSESSGGEGNANIQVRGIPISTGGAKFLQIHEDGLPILEFGDIAFGNADIFLRTDANIARVEAIRGGSASTFASNSPGGIINLISKTGEQEGGSIQATAGVDYGEFRLDADYGGKLSDSLSYHFGGFYRVGEGPRRAGYDGNKGGQIRGNITKTFDGGFFRVNFKYLDDRAIAYLPSPVRVTGSNANPNYQALPGLSPNNDTIHSVFFTRAVTLDGQNNREVDDIRDGQRPLVKAIGFEAQFDVADGWTVNNKFRYANISGRFISPFPATSDNGSVLANTVANIARDTITPVPVTIPATVRPPLTGSTLFYATGPNAGTQITNPASINAIGIVLFNTKLNSLDNITNDLRISHSFDTGGGNLDFTAGFYKSRQTIDVNWTWSSYLLEANGNNAALLDVRNAAFVSAANPEGRVTDGGLTAYGAAFFGNCCRRTYNVDFDTNAPYASLSFKAGALTVDGSLRYDLGAVRGFVVGDGPVVPTDVDGNGIISVPEQQTTILPLVAQRPVNYNYRYLSYSGGVNYKLSDALAVFARYSRGGRANADRFVFGGNTSPTSGRLLPGARPVDFVKQAEVGVKYQSGGLNLYGTGFYARTEEQNFEATTQRSTANTYRAYGLEFEGNYRIGGFNLAASGTYTNARITASLDRTVVGNRPRRQADFIYKFTPTFTQDIFTVGGSVIGTTASFAQDNNGLKLPAFAQVNAFLAIRPIERIQLSVNANNLFDVAGFTEAEEGSIPGNGIVRARSINGRTISVSAKFDF
jgi:outer membrane receptor protein involved in Fe transport